MQEATYITKSYPAQTTRLYYLQPPYSSLHILYASIESITKLTMNFEYDNHSSRSLIVWILWRKMSWIWINFLYYYCQPSTGLTNKTTKCSTTLPRTPLTSAHKKYYIGTTVKIKGKVTLLPICYSHMMNMILLFNLIRKTKTKTKESFMLIKSDWIKLSNGN